MLNLKVSELGKGSHFGENALLADGEDEICSEQIVAKTSVTLKVFTRSKFQARCGTAVWQFHFRWDQGSVNSDTIFSPAIGVSQSSHSSSRKMRFALESDSGTAVSQAMTTNYEY